MRAGLPARNQDELEGRVRSVMRWLQLRPKESVLISAIHVLPTQRNMMYLAARLISQLMPRSSFKLGVRMVNAYKDSKE